MTDQMWLTGRIIAAVPLDLTSKDGVGQFSLDNDPDLGARVVVDWQHSSGHDRDPAEGQLRILDGDRHGAAEDLTCDGHRCDCFWGRVLGE
jgi:hypothetical protein